MWHVSACMPPSPKAARHRGSHATTAQTALCSSFIVTASQRPTTGVLQQKRAAEAALRSSSLCWTIVRPGLLLGKVGQQGGLLLGGPGRWTGDTLADRVDGAGMRATPLKCASPFLVSSGAVCAATRLQVAEVCVMALTDADGLFSSRIVEVVAHPDVPQGTVMAI